MKRVVVGVFDSDTDAQHALQLLVAEGTDPDDVRITHAQGQGGAASSAQADTGLMNRVRGFFSDMFSPDTAPEVGHYAEVVRRGGALLGVEVDSDAQLQDVQKALASAGAVDIDQRIDSWRAQDSGSGAAQVSRAGMDTTADRAEDVIPVVEEELAVGKHRVSTGGLRVYARAVETPVTEAVQLRTEHAAVERHPMDRPATSADLTHLQDRTIEVRETAEVAVVQKTARVVEEVRVSKTVEERSERIDDTLRSTEVTVERLGSEPGSQTRAFDGHDQAFRSDYAARYAGQGGRYEDYEPAYRYGQSLKGNSRYADQDWEVLEPQARTDWEHRHPAGSWEQVKARAPWLGACQALTLPGRRQCVPIHRGRSPVRWGLGACCRVETAELARALEAMRAQARDEQAIQYG